MDSTGVERTEMDHEMLLPHEIMGCFYGQAETFALLTGGSQQVPMYANWSLARPEFRCIASA